VLELPSGETVSGAGAICRLLLSNAKVLLLLCLFGYSFTLTLTRPALIYVVPWSEFPTVSSYPHHPHSMCADQLCDLALSAPRVMDLHRKPSMPASEYSVDPSQAEIEGAMHR
jgi:hypothetical protein